jgi:hypothetical protein
MDAKLKKIQITPMKFDKEGEIQKEEFATLTIEVPMDSTSQRAAVINLCLPAATENALISRRSWTTHNSR